MPLEEHNAQLRAVIEQNKRTLDRMRHLLVTLEKSISSVAPSKASSEKKVILIVDDNPSDANLLESSVQKLRLQNPLQIVSDGAEAIAYIKGDGRYSDRALYPEPLLLFLDLKMPSGVDGFDVLTWLKHHPQYAAFPVVVMSSSGEVKQLNRAYNLGAKSYLTKPINPEEIRATFETLHIPMAA
jgi:CheY-like chemotaxis protein